MFSESLLVGLASSRHFFTRCEHLLICEEECVDPLWLQRSSWLLWPLRWRRRFRRAERGRRVHCLLPALLLPPSWRSAGTAQEKHLSAAGVSVAWPGTRVFVTHLPEAQLVVQVFIHLLDHVLQAEVSLWSSQLLHHQLQLLQVDVIVSFDVVPAQNRGENKPAAVELFRNVTCVQLVR